MNRIRKLSHRLALVSAAALALPATMASATAYNVDWLQLAPTPFNTTPPIVGTYAAPAGLGNVTVGYTSLPGFVYARQTVTSPNLSNASFTSVANPADTYTWTAHETFGATYNNSPAPATVLSQSWTIKFSFSAPLPANQQLVLGVFGLGKRTPGVGETIPDTRTLVKVLAQPTEYTYLGEYKPAIWGNTLFDGTSSTSQFTLENALTAPGGADPHWNSGLALVRFDKPLLGNQLTVFIDQTLGDGIGINVGFIQAIPEPGTWAMFGAGLAGVAFMARRRQGAAPQA